MAGLADLTDADRDAVAAGTATIASIADMLNISRQSIHRGFRRRGWATTAATTSPPPLPDVPTPATPVPAPPLPVPPFPCVLGMDALAQIVPSVATNAGLLLLTRVERLLGSEAVLGPSALRQAGAALQQALDTLERLGLAGGGNGEQTNAIVIEVMDAAEVERVRERVEAEHAGVFPDRTPDDDADSLEGEPDGLTVGRGGAASAISAPTANVFTGPSQRRLARPPRLHNCPSPERPTSTASRRACIRRPAPAARGS